MSNISSSVKGYSQRPMAHTHCDQLRFGTSLFVDALLCTRQDPRWASRLPLTFQNKAWADQSGLSRPYFSVSPGSCLLPAVLTMQATWNGREERVKQTEVIQSHRGGDAKRINLRVISPEVLSSLASFMKVISNIMEFNDWILPLNHIKTSLLKWEMDTLRLWTTSHRVMKSS